MADERLEIALTDALAEVCLRVAKTAIPSKTLVTALKIRRRASNEVTLSVPHYWAVYLHDGRGNVTPKQGSYLAWFINPADDPRLVSGAGPERLTQVRYLREVWTREQLVSALRSGRLVFAREASSTLPGARFFVEPPMSTLAQTEEIQATARRVIAQHLADQLPPDSTFKVTFPL